MVKYHHRRAYQEDGNLTRRTELQYSSNIIMEYMRYRHERDDRISYKQENLQSLRNYIQWQLLLVDDRWKNKSLSHKNNQWASRNNDYNITDRNQNETHSSLDIEDDE